MNANQWPKTSSKEFVSIRDRRPVNFFTKIKSNMEKSAFHKFKLNNWRENLKKKYIVKAREDDELLRKFCSSFSTTLQGYSVKTTTTPAVKVEINHSSSPDRSQTASHRIDDTPPVPPPRNIPSIPPSLPPVPSSLAPYRRTTPSSSPQPNYLYTPTRNHFPPQQTFDLYEIQNKLLNYYDRNSPSSGFYSCVSSSASPSSPSIYETHLIDKQPRMPILEPVKSRKLNQPQPQTALPLTSTPESKPPPPPPPPPYSIPQPPCYDFATGKVHRHSPVPERKTPSEPNDSKIRNYSPQAFKFFMEQHIENVIKSRKQRVYRQLQLETEMREMGLSVEEQNQMRRMLYQKESNFIRLKRSKLDKSMFTRIQVIGTGAFGEVSLVRKNNSHQLYAMKTLRKADVLRRNQVAHVKAERDILAEADNDWVVKLYFSFQDANYLYFVMEYIPGGDLMSLLIKLGIFEEDLARFYVAELICAVESVHKIGFIHRDIKPDNILIDRDGHIKLTDFGLCTGFRWTHNSKYYENGHSRQNSMEWSKSVDCKCVKLKLLERRRRREENHRCLAHSLVGTPNYIAPEVLLRNGYTQLCDWWSVGVVLYEMLIGYPPFRDDYPPRTQEKIINWRTTLKIPQNANIAPEAADLILKLCTSPEQRLGKNADEVKQHPFLACIDFGRGVRKLRPPYIPKIVHATDTSNFDPVQSDDSGDESSSLESNSSDDETGTPTRRSNNEFFAEFTFRRFFDDDRGVAFREKVNNFLDDQDSHNAIFV